VLEILRGREFIAVAYEQFAADPVAELQLLLQKLRAAGVAVGEAARETGEIFDRKLDHTPPPAANPVRLLMNPAQLALHSDCLNAVRDNCLPARPQAIDKAALARIDGMARAFAQVVDAAQVAARLDEKSAALETALQQLALAQQQTGEVQAERDSLLGLHEELQAEHRALAEAHRRDVAELQSLRDTREELVQMTDRANELTAALAGSERELRDANDKADYLFHQLDHSYHKVLSFSESGLGGLYAGLSRIYKLLTGQRRRNTALDDVLDDASEHFDSYPRPDVSGDESRLRLLAAMLRYVLAHPVASLRSFSWPRLKRAWAVFRRSERRDLAVWVKQRFPAPDDIEHISLLPELGEELDSLELEFEPCAQPRVSIIMPVFNQYRMTVFCLRSLLEHSGEVEYEVILADDASTDLTASIEDRVRGLVVERAGANRGFVLNCNAAAERARGEFLLFLNNDTAMTAGWLSTLVATLDKLPGAGVVGPKLLYGDGALQEAGGIIWNDASGWNYGRMDQPGEPGYNYLREVDYVSGACLLVRHSLWRELGGFDTRFAPAYYEDTDLCFAARAAGFSVVYQPASTVFHFEGVSNGTDLASGIKQYQLDNQARFAAKWEATLWREHFPNGESVFRARDRSRNKRTVLVVDHYVPSYDKDAGSRSTWQYLKLLVEMGYNVKFLGANFFPHQPYTAELQQLGVEVLVGESMARGLDSWLTRHAADIDVVYLNRPHVAEQFLGSIRKMQPRPVLAFFGHDLHYLRKQRELELTDDPAARTEAGDWRQREYRLFEQVDHIYYPSQVEVDEILEYAPNAPVRAIPLYVVEETPLPGYAAGERSGMLFVGGFNHPPNADGVCWFVEQVLPLVRARAPQLELHLVGSNMPDDIRGLGGEGLVVHGYLDDSELEAMYRKVKMVVVPLRYGAGVKGKVIEALQQGVPLVTTAVGAEGLPDAGDVMYIADEPADFAEKIMQVEEGAPAVSELLRGYTAYLSAHFSKARARDIICRDFGEPELEPR
jgi:GT2 family glycosyltransferase